MLVERSSELERLSEVASGTRGLVVTIRGEPGIGKSTLLEAFQERITADAEVVIGRCDDLSTPQPLGPLWDMADAVPDLTQPLAMGDRPAATRAILDLLTRRMRRTVVIIEDMQWADDATIDTVKWIGRRIRSTNGVLILTYRDTEVHDRHPLRGLLGDLSPADTVRMRLGPLSSEGIGALLGSAVDADEIRRMTGGNPLLVVEYSTSLDGDGASLGDLVTARLNRLEPQVREAISSLAVRPGDIPIDLARSVVADLDRVLPAAERNGFLVADRATVRFRHELIRRTIAASLPTSERSALHRKFLERLPPDADASIVAHHASGAGDVRQLVVAAPAAASHAARVGAHRQAVAHYRTLTDHLDAIDPVELPRILEDWALEEFYAHELGAAVDLATRAAAEFRRLDDRSAEARATAKLATHHWFAGNRTAALEAIAAAADAIEDGADPTALAEVAEARAYLTMMRGDLPGAASLVDQAIAAAQEAGNERLIVRALNSRGTMANVKGYPAGMLLLDETRGRAAELGLWYEEARALLNGAWSALEHRDLAVAFERLDEVLSLADRHDLGAADHYGQALRVRALDLAGEWGEAVAEAERLVGEGGVAAMTVRPSLAAIATRRGAPDAGTLTSLAWTEAVPEEFQRIGPAAVAVAEHAWITGTAVDPDALLGALHLGLSSGFVWTTGQLAAWLWRLGFAEPAPDTFSAPYDALFRGAVDDAASMWEAAACPYEQALTLLAGTSGDRLRAVEMFETLGATAVAARVRQDLRRDGIEVPRGRASTTRENPAGLTSRQMEVLGLLSEGLTNAEISERLFLSSRTVENHVSAVLGKLGASDRTEAVDAARRFGILD